MRSSSRAALIVVVTLVAYLPALRNGFIWDDDAWLMKNPTLHGLTGLRDLWFNLTALQQYYPITGMTFWIQYQLWGFHPLGYHLLNVLFHAGSAVLFGFILQKLGLRGGWFAAALFAVHPVMVESVAWVTEIKNTLSTAFYLGSILAYLNFENFETRAQPRNWKWFIVSLFLFSCALLTKSVTCSLPVALAILLWWKRDRVRVADLRPLLPFFAIGIPIGLLTAWLEVHHVGATGPAFELSFDQRCIVAGRAIFFYLSKLIWPARLTFIYPRWEFTSHWLLLFPGLVLIGLGLLWSFRRHIGRGPFAATAFFIITLGPILGFMNGYAQQFSFVADHWDYLPSLGLISLTSAIPEFLSFLNDKARGTVLAFTLLALAALTWHQSLFYQNIETIWRDTLAKNPNCWLAHNNLGVDLRDQRRFDEAADQFEAAIRTKPGYYEAEDNLGEVFLAQEQIEKAAARIDNSLAINSGYVPAHWDKALILARQGRHTEAYAIVREGLRQTPIHLNGLNNFAWLLATSADQSIRDPYGAEDLAQRCCELSGYSNPAHLDTLAAAYAAEGRFDEARQTASKALSLATRSSNRALIGEITARLDLYRRGRRFEER